MDLYWPQHKVYLYGRVAILPRLLEGQDFDRVAIAHYFPSTSVSELIDSLRIYEKNGYFQVEIRLGIDYLKQERADFVMASRADPVYSTPRNPPNIDAIRPKVVNQLPLTAEETRSLIKLLPRVSIDKYLRFRLADVNRQKFTGELITYLKKYQQGDLTTDTDIDPTNYNGRQHKLFSAAARDYAKHGYSPIIKASDIQPDEPEPDAFWELILTHQLVDNNIELVTMGYNDRAESVAPGLSFHHQGAIAFAKFRITSTHFQQIVSPLPKSLKPAHNSGVVNIQPAKTIEARATLKFDGNAIVIVLDSGEKIPLKTYRSGGALHEFMKHVINRPDKEIPRAVIQTEVEGCVTKQDMTELVRDCGFNRMLKIKFFPGTTANKVHFKSEALFSDTELQALKNANRR